MNTHLKNLSILALKVFNQSVEFTIIDDSKIGQDTNSVVDGRGGEGERGEGGGGSKRKSVYHIKIQKKIKYS